MLLDSPASASPALGALFQSFAGSVIADSRQNDLDFRGACIQEPNLLEAPPAAAGAKPESKPFRIESSRSQTTSPTAPSAPPCTCANSPSSCSEVS